MTCPAGHCFHEARLFRGWLGCCRCTAVAERMTAAEDSNKFVEFEQKSHGFPGASPSPLLTAIDRNVVKELRDVCGDDPGIARLFRHSALDLASFVEALDRKLASPIVVVR